jgi:hypothetical protein
LARGRGSSICGCLEFGIASGVFDYLGVMSLLIFKYLIKAAGCIVRPLGATRRTGTRGPQEKIQTKCP